LIDYSFHYTSRLKQASLQIRNQDTYSACCAVKKRPR